MPDPNQFKPTKNCVRIIYFVHIFHPLWFLEKNMGCYYDAKTSAWLCHRNMTFKGKILLILFCSFFNHTVILFVSSPSTKFEVEFLLYIYVSPRTCTQFYPTFCWKIVKIWRSDKVLEMPRAQDFASFTSELLGALSGPHTPLSIFFSDRFALQSLFASS